MNNLRLLLSFMLLLASGAAFMFPTTTYACSCALIDVAEQINRHDLIFSGTVQHIRKPVGIIQSTADDMKVTIHVDQRWKGEASYETIVHTAQSSVSCGYPFKLDQHYLVYAIQNEGKVQTGLCTATKPLSDASQDLHLLGEGVAVVPPPNSSLFKLSLQSLTILFVAIVVLTITAIRIIKKSNN